MSAVAFLSFLEPYKSFRALRLLENQRFFPLSLAFKEETSEHSIEINISLHMNFRDSQNAYYEEQPDGSIQIIVNTSSRTCLSPLNSILKNLSRSVHWTPNNVIPNYYIIHSFEYMIYHQYGGVLHHGPPAWSFHYCQYCLLLLQGFDNDFCNMLKSSNWPPTVHLSNKLVGFFPLVLRVWGISKNIL